MFIYVPQCACFVVSVYQFSSLFSLPVDGFSMKLKASEMHRGYFILAPLQGYSLLAGKGGSKEDMILWQGTSESP